MRPVLNWIDKITEEEGTDIGCCVYDLAFKPDGSELLVAADNRVLIYDAAEGHMLQSLKGHKDLVYAVAWSHDGEKFASGSADKTVILWTEQHEGTLKYSHGEAIQCLAFSPVTNVLLSCSMNDFGQWSSLEKNVQKQRVQGKCTSCAWSSDGSLYAIGMYEGYVTIRTSSNMTQEPLARIDRPGGEPVWAIRFSSPRGGEDPNARYGNAPSGEILCVTDWSKTVSFYDLEGNKVVKEDRELDYDPTCMEYFNGGQFLIVGGSNKHVQLYTRLGTNLGIIAQMDTWVWSVRTKPNSNTVVVGCVDGTLACYQLMFSTVHGLHKERYAFRENMTDVVVQHLGNQTSTRIRCNDLVKKVAIYNHKLAVQLTDRLHIYRQSSGDQDNESLEFKLVERINKAFECSLLVVCANHVILCQERRLQCYDHKGLKQREWAVESQIRYIKVVGGPAGKETVLVGLKTGEVCKIFVDNPFPIIMLKISSPVKCLDLSISRKLIGLVDENGIAMVFNTKSKELLFQEPNCTSLAFNTENENLLCYSGNGVLTIRAAHFPGFQQRLMGFVVGFTGNRVFCLHMYLMTAMEVPFSNQLYQYIEMKNFEGAYEIAALGATNDDWDILGTEALNALNLEVAAKAFARNKDYRSLQLLAEIKEMQQRAEPDLLIKAHILAYQRRFREVAQLYRSNGYEQKAMELFTELRMFDDAQELMANSSGETQKMLMRKRADWAKDSNEPKVAAEMFISSGDYEKAILLIVENDWMDLALNVMRKLDRGDTDNLRRLAAYFIRKGEFGLAGKIFQGMNDTRALVEMHVAAEHWTDAFAIADRFTKYVEDVYLPYARHLAENDQFEEAQKAFHKAGREVEALRVLEQLTENAVSEHRFADAAYYYWMLGMQYIERAKENPSLIPKSREAAEMAECYYAYDAVHLYCNQPFTSHSPETLLNMGRFLSNKPPMKRIARVQIFFCLSKIGKELGAYKLARDALDKLTQLVLPVKYEKIVEVNIVKIRAKPFTDAEELQPMCYRCGLNNPLTGGNSCVHCKTPFVFSFATFEVLPLVEFFIEESIDFAEAKQLIEAEPPLNEANYNPFQKAKKGSRVVLNKDQLSRLEKGQVIIAEHCEPLTPKYFFNLIPSISISKCPGCFKMFHMDDFEMAVLQKGACPFCRTTQTRENAHYYDDD